MKGILEETSTLEKAAIFMFAIVLVICELADIYFNIVPWITQEARTLRGVCYSIVKAAWRFHEKLAGIIRDFSSGHYYIPWRQGNIVVLTNPESIRELSDATQLSQRAVYSDIFGFKYNMSHVDTHLDPNEQAPHRYKLFATAIRGVGTAQLPSLVPLLQASLHRALSEMVDSAPVAFDGWHNVQLAPLMRRCATGMLGTYFFGDMMYNEPEFNHATDKFYQDVIRGMSILPLFPSFAKAVAYRFLTNDGRALKLLFDRMSKAIGDPVNGWREEDELKRLTLLGTMIHHTRDSDYWTTNLIIQAVVGIWFAASHQPWINLHFVFLELCERPEYVELLREEIRNQGCLNFESISQLKKLDSFIKECVRLNPLDRSMCLLFPITQIISVFLMYLCSGHSPESPNGLYICS
jgi:cytochrome P450